MCSNKLKEYILSHMGDESLKCKICGRILSSKLNIKIHYASVHSQHVLEEPKEDQYRCNMCGKIYTQYSFLSRHRRACHEQNVQYTCDHCGESFARFFTLAEHIRGHMSEGYLKCKICGKNFSSNWKLKVHSESIHSQPAMEGPQKDWYKCDKCGKMYTRYHFLIRHMRSCSEPKFTCDHCGKSFSRLKTLRKHILGHKGDEHLKCKICGKIFSSKQNVSIHVKACHENVRYTCDHCGKSFSQSCKLKDHILSHKGEQFKCEICGKIFYSKPRVNKHVKECHENVQYTCDHCGKSFSRLKILEEHILGHMGDERLKCKICKKSFSSMGSLKIHCFSVHSQHVMEEPEEGQYRCDQCGKIYFKYNFLSRHRRACHEQNVRYTCDHCGKSFASFFQLAEHIRGHMSEDHLKCNICGKILSSKWGLKLHHASVHSQPVMEGPERNRFKCDLCGKMYTRPRSLKLHIRARHEQNVQYTCDHCGKSFVELKTARKHIVGHMGDERLNCKICKKSFSSMGCLRTHCVSVHLKPAEKDCVSVHSKPTDKGFETKARVKCQHCGKMIRRHCFKYHERIHTSEKPFECDRCHRRFHWKQSLKRHQMVHSQGADASSSAVDTMGCSTEDSSLKTIDRILAECRIKMEDAQVSTT